MPKSTVLPSWFAFASGLLMVACSPTATPAPSHGGTGGVGSGGSTGLGGSVATGTGGSSPSGSGGATNPGFGGTMGPPAGGGGTGGTAPPSGATDAAVDAPTRDVPATTDSAPDGAAGGGPSSCAAASYAVCMDFETLPDSKWTGIGTNVQMGKAAHGNAAFHGPPSSGISTTQLGAITNVAWGRFYLHMTPKAPVGHGAMVMMFDQPGRNGNWYEVGFEYNALQGNWHGNGGEKYMHTKQLLQDKWTCVEFFMDGANGAPVQLWMDGQPIVYSQIAGSPSISKTNKFSLFQIGMTPYHGLSTISYEGNAMPMTDMWIDDVALDTKRIGCIDK